jgi:hypothetical protein
MLLHSVDLTLCSTNIAHGQQKCGTQSHIYISLIEWLTHWFIIFFFFQEELMRQIDDFIKHVSSFWCRGETFLLPVAKRVWGKACTEL